jgi:hypothetical protein
MMKVKKTKIQRPSKQEQEESIKLQLSEWIAGRPHHNKVRDECTPDFSCCNPALLASEAERIEFRDAKFRACFCCEK